MKKETGDLLFSWFYIGWILFALLSALRIGIVHGFNSIDFQFTLVVYLFIGIPLAYVWYKQIKKGEFRLKPLK